MRYLGRSLLIFLAVSVVLSAILRLFVVEAFKIPAVSMEPTLVVGDHIFVTKIAYTPKRGDVVVFAFPRDETKDFVKRIVALEGDVIRVAKNQIYLNGKAIDRKRISGPCTYEDRDERGVFVTKKCVAYTERIGGQAYRVIQEIPSLSLDSPSYKVPPGQAFVMGDNRDNSYDSRAWGTVSLEKIKGKAWVIWSSEGPHGQRDGRFWKKVHKGT